MTERPILRAGEAVKVHVSVVGRSELWQSAVAGAAGGIVGATVAGAAQSRQAENRNYNIRGRALDQRLSVAGVDVATILRGACERRLRPVSGLPHSGNTLKIEVVRYGAETVSVSGFKNSARPYLSLSASLLDGGGKIIKKGRYFINARKTELVPALTLDSYTHSPAAFRDAMEKYSTHLASQIIE